MDTRLIRRLIFWSIGATALVFALALTSLFLHRRQQLMEQAQQDAVSSLFMASNLFCDRLELAKTAVINSAIPENESESRRIVENLLHNNHDIYGTAIAIRPEIARKYCGKERLFIYSYRTPSDSLCTLLNPDLGGFTFNYPARDWFQYPVENGVGHWSEPYRDSLTSGELMVSYSAPISLQDSTVLGVLLADITLKEGIRSIVEEVDSIHDHRTYLLSREGQLVFGDTTNIADAVVYTETLPDIGWTLGHVIDKDTLFRPLHREIYNMVALFILTVLILYFTIYYTIRGMTRPAVKRQMRIKAELDVATRIQEGMLPKAVPPFPGRSDLDVASVVQPAKEVGGDFYNYFLEEDNVYFIIGDVAGKGVPAALIMAIATELFMLSAPGKSDPAEIMEYINRALCRDSRENMFITVIVGILDLKTRKLTLCNAGHNLPILISGGKERTLKLESNIPTGVLDDYTYGSKEFDFPAGSKLLLYTDGVTEAENSRHEQFGVQRLVRVVQENLSADAHRLYTAIESAVHDFTSGYEQSDDITIFILDSFPSSPTA